MLCRTLCVDACCGMLALIASLPLDDGVLYTFGDDTFGELGHGGSRADTYDDVWANTTKPPEKDHISGRYAVPGLCVYRQYGMFSPFGTHLHSSVLYKTYP